MKDGVNYEQLVEKALRRVVHDVLEIASRDGLYGDQHFFVTFCTSDSRNSIPQWLLVNHPEEMSVILQHQFWDLAVDDEAFSVTLSFGGKPERLRVVFDTVSAFSDPASKFELQFRSSVPARKQQLPDASVPLGPAEITAEKKENTEGADNVVTLDAFRKK